jgi:hypothetical protein
MAKSTKALLTGQIQMCKTNPSIVSSKHLVGPHYQKHRDIDT